MSKIPVTDPDSDFGCDEETLTDKSVTASARFSDRRHSASSGKIR